MDAQIDLSLHRFARAWSREKMLAALHGCIALVTVAVGVLGLPGDSWLKQMLGSSIAIHALYGFLLCGLVLVRCQWRVQRSPRMLPGDIRELSRHLSHTVYVMLYVVLGVREAIGIYNVLRHGGPADFNLFDPRFRGGPDHAGFDPRDDFQLFVASGFFALLFVRVLAFTLWSRSRRRAAVMAANLRGPRCMHPG
jgi:cytochrome b561